MTLMKNPILPLLLLALLGLSAEQQSCKKKAVETPEAATEARSADFLRKKLAERNTSKVKYLNAQAKVSLSGDGQRINATANLIWIQDSVLWINVKKFGIEAVRALVTKDSVFVLNRLEKSYSAKSLESLQRQYNLPGGFDMITSVLLAKAWLPEKAALQSDVREELHRLSGTHEGIGLDYRIEEGRFLLRSETFLQLKDARNISIAYDDYRKLSPLGWFPYLCKVSAFSPEQGNSEIEVQIVDLEINVPKAYKFEVPTHYNKR
jgi:hypothetical protein